MNLAARSFLGAVLAMSNALHTPRFGVRVIASDEIPEFMPSCRNWRRRQLELAKRRVRQQGLR